MVRYAFAGFRHGHIYRLWDLVAKNENTEVAGAWEENEAAKKDAADNHGVQFTYDSYEALLADPTVDVVAIGDYYGRRGAMVIAALKAGKHVQIDKPVCTSLEELDEIEALVKKTGLKVGCMLDMRYSSYALTVKDIIDAGTLGEIHQVMFTGQHPLMYGSRPSWYFEEGKHGGTINDLAIHGVDIVKHITGKKMKRVVAARTWNAFADKEPNFSDGAQFMLELDGGTGVIADVSYSAPGLVTYSMPQYWRFTYWGTKGMLEYNNVEGNVGGDISMTLTETQETVHVPVKEVTRTYLDSFLDEIAGKDCEFTTAEVIESSRDTLMIQAAAKA